MTSLQSLKCPACSGVDLAFFSPEEKDRICTSLNFDRTPEVVSKYSIPGEWISGTQSSLEDGIRGSVSNIAHKILDRISHEGCGIVISKKREGGQLHRFAGGVVNGQFYLYWISQKFFAFGACSRVYHAFDLLNLKASTKVYKETLPIALAPEDVAFESARQASKRATRELFRECTALKKIHTQSEFSDELRSRVTPLPDFICLGNEYQIGSGKFRTRGYITKKFDQDLAQMVKAGISDLALKTHLCAEMILTVLTCHNNEIALGDLKLDNFLYLEERVYAADAGSWCFPRDPKLSMYARAYRWEHDNVQIYQLERDFKEGKLPYSDVPKGDQIFFETKMSYERALDITALAICCYRVLTGHAPFRCEKDSAICCLYPSNFGSQREVLVAAGFGAIADLFERMVTYRWEERPDAQEVQTEYLEIFYPQRS
jgi:serine/threonine protein kinase